MRRRGPRGRIVNLSLSLRHAASESEELRQPESYRRNIFDNKIKVKPQISHFLRFHNNEIAIFAIFEVTMLDMKILLP